MQTHTLCDGQSIMKSTFGIELSEGEKSLKVALVITNQPSRPINQRHTCVSEMIKNHVRHIQAQ